MVWELDIIENDEEIHTFRILPFWLHVTLVINNNIKK